MTKQINERIDYLLDKKQLTKDVRDRNPDNLNRNLVPFVLPVRPTLVGIVMSSIIESSSKVVIKDGVLTLKFDPMGMGVCTDDIYKKLKNIKHTQKNQPEHVFDKQNFFELLMD